MDKSFTWPTSFKFNLSSWWLIQSTKFGLKKNPVHTSSKHSMHGTTWVKFICLYRFSGCFDKRKDESIKAILSKNCGKGWSFIHVLLIVEKEVNFAEIISDFSRMKTQNHWLPQKIPMPKAKFKYSARTILCKSIPTQITFPHLLSLLSVLCEMVTCQTGSST